MATTLSPYIFFSGNCAEAMEFYHGIFGGELKMQRLADVPGMEVKPGMEERIMHADLSGGAVSFFGSDNDKDEPYPAGAITLSLTGKDTEELTGFFNALAAGGTITSPLKKEYWGDTFGTLTDTYGTDWMVNISAE